MERSLRLRSVTVWLRSWMPSAPLSERLWLSGAEATRRFSRLQAFDEDADDVAWVRGKD
ncbi:hypothetical protein Lepto7375DRAFT_5217 [Leptolyngbya sp. PCC 7375]|nr:hypothetical protein Lepto7375DRAFT_5217 [Leptolyngbya sp. PCC 7375]